MTPFKALYGQDPPHIIRLGKGHTPVDSLEEMLREREAILDELRFNLIQAQQRMKKNANLKRREVEFEVGDKVYLKLQPYHQQSLARLPFSKLAASFDGPFTVQRVGEVAYKLDLPSHSKIHPVFHVSHLKRSLGDSPQSTLMSSLSG